MNKDFLKSTCNLTLEVFRTLDGWILFSDWRSRNRLPKRRKTFFIHGGTFLSSGVRKCMFSTKTVITKDRETRNIEQAKYIPERQSVMHKLSSNPSITWSAKPHKKRCCNYLFIYLIFNYFLFDFEHVWQSIFWFFLINCSLKNIHYEGFFTIIKFYKFFEYSLPFYLQTLTDYTISESGYQWLSFRQTAPNCPHESMIL